MPLDTYRNKRDFSRTPEPRGARPRRTKAPIFVVQKHAARQLHYDFRLELDGVLKSWAVPKQPDLDPTAKRLAVRVEDHPLDYATFEGRIPEGQYGAGKVEVWDSGTWQAEGDPRRGYAQGKLSFILDGRRLAGRWALVRMGGRARGKRRDNWLLIKERDGGGSTRAGRRVRLRRHASRSARAPRFGSSTMEVAGVPLTHPDRLLYPEQGLTKRDLAEFYAGISAWILPHIVERPLSMLRCPEGRRKACFFQKHAGRGVPKHLKPVMIQEDRARREYLFVEDERGLVSLVQMGVLEIHPWGSRVGSIDEPDRLILDLDPGPGVSWTRVVEGAREIQALLDTFDLVSFAKTTGGKGVHVVVPLGPRQSWPMLKDFAHTIALEMVRRSPRGYTATLSKAERAGKIFIDYLRNSRGATAVAAYSTRAREGAPVSIPLAWAELSAGLRSDSYTVENLRTRLDGLKKDPWEGFFEIRQRIPRTLWAQHRT